jgi:predicted O-methyltransferase YrrM
MNVRAVILNKLYRGQDPFASFTRSPSDLQGWPGSVHPYLDKAITKHHPKVVVEIGVWKGASSIHMASILRDQGIDGVVVAVDTWLGSSEHWLDETWFQDLGLKDGRPTVMQKFMSNVVAQGLERYILPLPLDSINAAETLKQLGIKIDLLHIDAAHDEGSVAQDLKAWWPLLREGGVLIGDDYFPEGRLWPGVKKAFDAFTQALNLPYEVNTPKIRITKVIQTTASLQPIRSSEPGQAGVQPLLELPETLEYTGEFGPELILFLPFCEWLSRAGLLKGRRVKTYQGMRCFYDHLDCLEIVEKPEPRKYITPDKRLAVLPVKNEHSYGRPSRFHYFPDLRSKFLAKPMLPDLATEGKRPLLVVHNKYNPEWDGPPINFIDPPTLDRVFSKLKRHFTIVYIRHTRHRTDLTDGYSHDHNTKRPADGLDDLSVLKRHPDVIDFEDLYAKHKALGGQQDLNTFKNVLYSRCFRFISTQGGGAHHIATFSGAVLVILHKRGKETNLAYTRGCYKFLSSPAPVLTISADSEQLLHALPTFLESIDKPRDSRRRAKR